MGYITSTYLAYGLRIPTDAHPWHESGRIDAGLTTIRDLCPDVGHLTAGQYDQDMVFLVTQYTEIELGTYGRTTTATAEQVADWNRQLANAVDHLGYGHIRDLDAPGWIAIPDVS
ncbi:hypothetical protein [Streptomyces sp. ML-6]|uniref:hypothetical protein n=1 Tax=Streptomyces sp. ML-6 TaxID=2982693 RepID=UPI0024C0D613|nr:hypothetical protein [Streptomyces sp. ML-6]MDK0520366.1 hypothetical protein [Streptomyces sp. ML-6]